MRSQRLPWRLSRASSTKTVCGVYCCARRAIQLCPLPHHLQAYRAARANPMRRGSDRITSATEFCSMRSLFPSLAAALTILLPVSDSLAAVHPESPSALRLIGTVDMPGIEGDFDHFGVDLKNNRLFLAAEEHHTVEVFDLHNGKPVHSIKGFD